MVGVLDILLLFLLCKYLHLHNKKSTFAPKTGKYDK